jgi:outer membrane protein OmpA-like peptidoglycan-associated protein
MMRLPKWLVLTALAASLLTRDARAAEVAEKRFALTPFVGWTFFDKELTSETGPMLNDDAYFGGRATARLVSMVWLDLAGGVTYCEACGLDANWTHFSANLMLAPVNVRRFSPFVSLGGGVSKFSPRVSTDDLDGTFEAAGGVKVRLTDAIGLRLEARNVLLVPKTDWNKSHIDNMVLGAGLVFGFGGAPEDEDADGVPDKLDKCPGTPAGCHVDAQGCPIDADGDGVCDGIDQCPDTPHGATVDARGCPTDSDGDGVWDGIDRCADTPRGCTVDVNGCPIDTDGDGVCDGLDTCPGTIKGCTVDAHGCPSDSDGDGVCDGLDQCPGTVAGVKVESDGCPPSEVKQRETELLDTGMIRLQDVHFETAKSNILPESYHALDVVGEVLAKWPQLKIEVGGHCDSRGTDAYNLGLSRRRVASVRSYLLAKFPKLEAAQMTSKGYGESRPLVPNDSPANMAQNRRVEFVVINKEVLKQSKP